MATQTVSPMTQGVSVREMLERLAKMPGATDIMAAIAAPQHSEPTPTAKPRMVTQSRGKVTHSTGRLTPPAKVSTARSNKPAKEEFNPRSYYSLDPASELPLNASGAFLGISTSEQYWGNTHIIGLTRKAISLNPKTLMLLATLDWNAIAEHLSASLPAEYLS